MTVFLISFWSVFYVKNEGKNFKKISKKFQKKFKQISKKFQKKFTKNRLLFENRGQKFDFSSKKRILIRFFKIVKKIENSWKMSKSRPKSSFCEKMMFFSKTQGKWRKNVSKILQIPCQTPLDFHKFIIILMIFQF